VKTEVDFKDYLLLAFVFGLSGLLAVVFQQSSLRGQYPIWEMFSTAFLVCEFLAISMLLAGLIRRQIGRAN